MCVCVPQNHDRSYTICPTVSTCTICPYYINIPSRRMTPIYIFSLHKKMITTMTNTYSRERTWTVIERATRELNTKLAATEKEKDAATEKASI